MAENQGKASGPAHSGVASCSLPSTAEVESLRQTIRTAHVYLKDYTDDAEMATHAKRILNNAMHAMSVGQ